MSRIKTTQVLRVLLMLSMVIGIMPMSVNASDAHEEITIPFNETLIFDEENTVVENEFFRTYKYSFTLVEETTLQFYGESGMGWGPNFTLYDAGGELIHEGLKYAEDLPAGDYEVWIDDDGYELQYGRGTLEAEVWIIPIVIPTITIPFNETLVFDEENTMVEYGEYRTFKFRFTLVEEMTLKFCGESSVDWVPSVFLYDVEGEYVEGGREFVAELPAGDYEVWIDDDGYDLYEGKGTLEAEGSSPFLSVKCLW